jgi:serine/threonine protein kinase
MLYQPGDLVLGKYRIDRFIGKGASAEVYLATHLELKAPRALKVLSRDLPGVGTTAFGDYRQRFQLEAQLGARIDHPNVIRVHDFHQDEDTLLPVMDYAAGRQAMAITRSTWSKSWTGPSRDPRDRPMMAIPAHLGKPQTLDSWPRQAHVGSGPKPRVRLLKRGRP